MVVPYTDGNVGVKGCRTSFLADHSDHDLFPGLLSTIVAPPFKDTGPIGLSQCCLVRLSLICPIWAQAVRPLSITWHDTTSLKMVIPLPLGQGILRLA